MTGTDLEALIKPANPRMVLLSTILLVATCTICGLLMPKLAPFETFKFCAFVVGPALAVSLLLESQGHIRRLIRVDVAALLALYALTFGEFLAPNLRVLYRTTPEAAVKACIGVLIGLAFLAIGRHFPLPRKKGKAFEQSLPPIRDKTVFHLFLVMTVLGFFYVFMTCGFNPLVVLENLTHARWDKPWVRSAQGDWRSAITELAMLLYVVAAMGGYILARPKSFSIIKRMTVIFVLAFLFFFDFCDGTRTNLLIRVSLFLAALLMASDPKKILFPALFTVATVVALAPLSAMMLRFRNFGLGAYLRGQSEIAYGNSFLIDNNMFSIARVMDVYPSIYPLPGMEIVILALTKPVPRVLWPGKPEGLTVPVETALGERGFTLATTYIGESYLAGGYVGIVIVSMLLGVAAATWNRIGVRARTNMDLVYYASGFFAAMVGMRSMLWITIALVPTVAFYAVGKLLLRKAGQRRKKAALGGQPSRRPPLPAPQQNPSERPPFVLGGESATRKDRLHTYCAPGSPGGGCMADRAPVKIAIVGCGAMSELGHLPALQGTKALVPTVLIDTDLARARSLAAKFGVPHASNQLADAAVHADAACVVVPHNVHTPVACDLISRGLPILIEKPLAVTLPECDPIIVAAEKAKVVLAVAMVRRFARSTRFMKDAIDQKAFGMVKSFRLVSGVAGVWPTKSNYLLDPDQAGGGVLMSNGVHDLDLLDYLFGAPKDLAFFADSDFGKTRRMENDAHIDMTTTQGIPGTVDLSRTRDLNNGLWITFEKAELYSPLYGDQITLTLPSGPVILGGALVDTRLEAGAGEQDFINMLTLQLEDFAAAVRGDKPAMVDGVAGRRTIETTTRCYSNVQPLALPWRGPVAGLEAVQ